MAMKIWMVEERLSKRHAWTLCDIVPDGMQDAKAIAAYYRQRASNWTEWEYRVAKYIREEPKP